MATWAKGIDFKNNSNTTRIGGIGLYGNDNTTEKIYLGFGSEPWNNTGLQITTTGINYKGNKVYHAGDKPTPADIGAASSSHTHSYLPLSGGTLTGSIKFSGGGWSGNAIALEAGNDSNGAYVGVGAGGLTVIGGGESTATTRASMTNGSEETMIVASDQDIKFFTGMQNGYDSRKIVTITAGGVLQAPQGITGNTSTATTLQTARTINGTSFNGSANITTANWGTARTITIGSTGKSVNGSGNVSWSLAEIGAAASSHGHSNINSRGNVTCETGTTSPAVTGMSMGQVYNNGYPTTYGNVISLRGSGHGQILVGWSGTSGAHDGLWVRSKRDVSDANWSGWTRVYTEAYKPYHWGTGNPSNTDGKPDGTIYFKYV